MTLVKYKLPKAGKNCKIFKKKLSRGAMVIPSRKPDISKIGEYE